MPPDSELYDNVGRTTEQIHAFNTNIPTVDDLRRWANRDGADFRDAISLPVVTGTVPVWGERLKQAETVAEFNSVIEAVLAKPHGALTELAEFLNSAAVWCGQNGEPEIAKQYLDASGRMSDLDQHVYGTAVQHLAADYERRTAKPPPEPTPTAAPALAPGKEPKRRAR